MLSEASFASNYKRSIVTINIASRKDSQGTQFCTDITNLQGYLSDLHIFAIV